MVNLEEMLKLYCSTATAVDGSFKSAKCAVYIKPKEIYYVVSQFIGAAEGNKIEISLCA